MTDRCKDCGSEGLFSGWFDADDLARSLGPGEAEPPGVRWTTFCNDCGSEWFPRPTRAARADA
jgi:hypothetical protein